MKFGRSTTIPSRKLCRLPIHVLVSAYSCDPVAGSEPGVGWAYLLSALEVCDQVDLLTRSKNADRVWAALNPEQRRRCNIRKFDLGPLMRRLKRALPIGTQIYYLVWQYRARSLVRRLHAGNDYDLAHHVTFASDWMNVAVSGVEGLRVIWGPVGGSTTTPISLYRYLGVRGASFDILRAFVACIGRRAFGNRVARNSDLVLAANSDVAKKLLRSSKCLVVRPNVALPESLIFESRTDDQDKVESSHLVGVGRLVPWKGWALALDAIAQLESRYTLTLIGSGTDLQRLRKRACDLGIENRVVMAGHLPRDEVVRYVREANAFLFPSFHDTSPWAVGEALSVGCPVVCLDLGGPNELVRRSGGVVVDHRSPALDEKLADGVRLARPSTDRSVWLQDALSHEMISWYREVSGK